MTAIITFLMVFLVQNTQNREARALHLKLDELIRVIKARKLLMNFEELSDKEAAEASPKTFRSRWRKQKAEGLLSVEVEDRLKDLSNIENLVRAETKDHRDDIGSLSPGRRLEGVACQQDSSVFIDELAFPAIA